MRLSLFHFVLAGGIATCATTAFSDDPPSDPQLSRGRVIYQKQCSMCHGDAGQGVVDKHDDPLIGDASIGELAKLITETMPDDAAKKCTGKDAQAVAAYIHHAFYSQAARLRNRPPRIGLARVTGDQLRQSLADLYAHFAGIIWTVEERGLKAQYFDGARPRRDKMKIERLDPLLDFDFGDTGPGEGINAKDFFIRWRGGLKVDETGEYEIAIRSSCAFICFFGGNDREFINNRVQSGDKTEFRRTMMLTAGRVYPIQVDFYQRKRKTEQPPARITLLWTPPRGVEQAIPTQHLIAVSAPPTFALQAILPPDDRTYGYERGIAVDRQWDNSTTMAAIEFADAAANELWPQFQRNRRGASNERRAQLRAFLVNLVSAAFRGPLDDATRKRYVDNQVDAEEDDAQAIKRSVLISLKSPRFLYPLLDGNRPASQRAANRLTLTLYDSLPSDKWLLERIDRGELETSAQIRAAAERMVKDYRTRGKTRSLVYEWLNLSKLNDGAKDEQVFPNFDRELVNDLQRSFNAFVDNVVWSETSDYRQLLLADWSFTTQRMSEYYGPDWSAAETGADEQDSAGLQRTAAAPQRRAGVLAHPYLMSGLAYRDSTSPIHRGVFLLRHVLGRTQRPPQEAFTPLNPKLHPDLTTRQRVELQTSPKTCRACHLKINNLGFALEHFDGVGRFRERERNHPILATGRYTSRTDETVEFTGVRELATYLARSEDGHRAFVGRAFQHFVKQPPAAYGPNTLDNLTNGFKQNQFNIRTLLVEIALVAAQPPK
ncbi:MAG: DUF1588 domain-containing protein [Pirellulaceae bacterium]|nr:DUF1588 domain-containing protein [Pirellulaceae bacterium]